MDPPASPDAEQVERFASDLDALVDRDSPVGIAASGGPDSLALLLLAVAARPGMVEAATVDHGLRAESRSEADMVAALCRRLDVPHAILAPDWEIPPDSAIQEKARDARYALLGEWARSRDLGAIATAHHSDDQAETLVMRLNRGSGVRGLAAIRPRSDLPGDNGMILVRPLLGWTHAELECLCAAAGIAPADDPSNRDQKFERVRVRQALESSDWIDAASLARSAANLADADDALNWAADEEWNHSVEAVDGEIRWRSPGAPAEIQRRIVGRAIGQLCSEGGGEPLRGREIDRFLGSLRAGEKATLRGVFGTGGDQWRFSAAAPRRTTGGGPFTAS